MEHEFLAFNRRVRLAWYFKGDETPRPRGVLRVRSNFDPSSKVAIPQAIGDFCSMVRHGALMRWHSARLVKKPSNLSAFDAAGLHWLRNNSDRVCVLDSDKNAGVVLCSREWIDSELDSHLSSLSYISLDSNQLVDFVSKVQHELIHIVEYYFQNGQLLEKEAFFLCSKVCSDLASLGNCIPKFRILPKLHKCPVSSRPLVNAPSSWEFHV